MKAGLPGAGPWRILDDCEAPKHNTLRAHSGRHGRGGTRTVQCRCPGALKLYAEDKGRRMETKYRPRIKQIEPSRPSTGMAVPDLFGAPCHAPRGAELMDAWQRSTGYTQQNVGRAVTWMCERRCPVRDRCELYVQVNEQPVGSWRGIYAGRTIADRKRDAERRAATRDASKLWPCWQLASRVVKAGYPRSDIRRDRPQAEPEPEPRPPARSRGSSAFRGELRKAQREALGHVAGRPWGALPLSDNTWRALVIRGLIERVPEGLRLTPAGVAAVERLDAQAKPC